MTNTSPLPISSHHLARQARLAHILAAQGLHSLILNAGPSLTYLTGLHFHLSERPVVACFIPGKAPVIILPLLESQKLKNLPFPVESFTFSDDPSTWTDVFRRALQSAGVASRRNGVEPRQLRLLEYQLLTSALSPADILPGDECVTALRMRKDDIEIAAMRKAVQIAEQALIATLPSVKIGMTERELATGLTLQLFRSGCDPQLPFTPIVSTGPNSANPHATPSERALSPDDLLVIDWGASFDGYVSDITRTFAIGKLDPEFEKIGRIVLEANAAGRSSARPGIPIEDIDQAARSLIEASGYGEYFTHRTGHGLGMECHEEPYIRSGNTTLLEPGMTFTVEPGIYLPGKNGVRIEDDVVITAYGSECLTSLPREILQLL